MSTKFNQFIERVLSHEGGYVNHPKDPGGETNWGITKTMPMPPEKWDLIALPEAVNGRLHSLWKETQGQGYDLRGALAICNW